MEARSKVVCVWCEAPLANTELFDEDAPIWYGMCDNCGSTRGGMFPFQNLYELGEAEYDALPMGAMQLDPEATVLAYNAAEEQLTGLHRGDVIGRNFFTEIAPCTRVQEFEGVFRDMVERGETARHAFDFVFRFAHGKRFVHIAMLYDASHEIALVLVQAASPDE